MRAPVMTLDEIDIERIDKLIENFNSDTIHIDQIDEDFLVECLEALKVTHRALELACDDIYGALSIYNKALTSVYEIKRYYLEQARKDLEQND